jgi:hypothetical protein
VESLQLLHFGDADIDTGTHPDHIADPEVGCAGQIGGRAAVPT